METEIQKENRERKERLGRVLAEERAQTDAQAARIAENDERTAGVNERYFAAEAERNAQAAANKSISLKPQSNAEAVAAEQARTNRPAINKPAEGWLDAHGTVPAPRKTPISLTPQPDRYPSGDPRHGMTEELIVRMGMDPNPDSPAFTPSKPTVEDKAGVQERMTAKLSQYNR